eukprot:11757487-Ditylum_brightwellii.AAC.1
MYGIWLYTCINRSSRQRAKSSVGKEAKAQAKEREDAEWEISNAQGLLQDAAKPSRPKEDNLTSEIQQLYAKTTEVENRATDMAEWRITFDADQQK